jgi:flagellar hook-associated protein 3 FlgL
MRTQFVSTASLLATPRSNVGRMQQQLVRLNQEVVTGRMADVGLNLGAQTSRSVTLHMDVAALDQMVSSNGQISSRLQQTQAALDKLRSDGESFLNRLVGTGTQDPQNIAVAARSAMADFVAGANASDGGNYLFGGINTGNPPIADFNGGPKAAIDAAFLAKFGITQDDPAVADIDPADLADFLDNEFADLFADPEWANTWSDASDTTVTSRISLSEKTSTSATANEPAMRKLAEVYSMVGYLGIDKLGTSAQQVLINKAIGLVSGGTKGLTDIQSSLGDTENQVKDATTRLQAQQSILQQRIGALEGVDPAEAKVKIDTLSNQIEMSYSLTVKLLQMSILNYV